MIRDLGLRESLYVVWAYSRHLQVGFDIPNNIEVANQFLEAELPQAILSDWALEQIIREAIKYSGIAARKNRTLTHWDTLADVANSFRDIEDKIYAETSIPNRIHLEIMRISHRQIVWQQQRYHWRWAIRYYKILNVPKIDAISRDSIGLSIFQVFLIGMTFLGMFFEQPRAARHLNIRIPGLTEEHLDAFLSFTCMKRNALIELLRSEHKLDEGFAYRYSSLRAFPIVQISHLGKDELACPVPILLFWRFTTGLYYALRAVSGFPTALGASFQNYVGDVLKGRITSEEMCVIPESEYKVGKNRKDTVDWILLDRRNACAFIECKAMRLTWASKAGMSDLTALDQDIRKLAGAIIQIYRTIRDYKQGRYRSLEFTADRTVLPILITLEDWYVSGVELPRRLQTALVEGMERAGLPLDWLTEMPYSVMSVDEFERAAGVMNAVGVETFVLNKVNSPEFRRWLYHSYCMDQYGEIVRALPRLFRAEYDELFEGLVQDVGERANLRP